MPKCIPDIIEPFSIAAAGVTRLILDSDLPGEFELHVIRGGPVYLWRGRKEIGQAQAAIVVGDNLTFDLAASAEGSAEMRYEGRVGEVTVYSDVETVGYIRVRQEER